MAELLALDREYRAQAAAGKLPRFAPREFNPRGEAWLPVLHAERGGQRYTVMFSHTARAYALGKIYDWVVIHADGGGTGRGRQYTVITSWWGGLRGRRIVRGREVETAAFYRAGGDEGPKAGARRSKNARNPSAKSLPSAIRASWRSSSSR